MMRFFKKKNRGQNVAEYAILIALVVGAIIAMQKFAQRGLQGRVRDATKFMVDNTNFSSSMPNATETYGTGQYVPYYEDTSYTTGKSDTETKSGDATDERFAIDSTSTRTGSGNMTFTPDTSVSNGMTIE